MAKTNQKIKKFKINIKKTNLRLDIIKGQRKGTGEEASNSTRTEDNRSRSFLQTGALQKGETHFNIRIPGYARATRTLTPTPTPPSVQNLPKNQPQNHPQNHPPPWKYGPPT